MLSTALKVVLRDPLRVASEIVSDPREAWAAFYDRFLADQDLPILSPAEAYPVHDDWEKRMHAHLGCPWPCAEAPEFWAVCAKATKELAAKGVNVGPESFKINNDGDQGLVRALWCLVRHLRPRNVVETGVGHGMTSRLILEALVRNGQGSLWSIDRPVKERHLHAQIGIAVGDQFRDRWTLLKGASRRHLPALLSRLGEVDLFLHDSLHTTSNVRFELDTAWPMLSARAAVVIDDIDSNWAFHTFAREQQRAHVSMVCEAEPIRPDFRRFNNKGLFGLILKDGARANSGAHA